MNLLIVGANFCTAPMHLRESLAFDREKLPRALNELTVRYGCEVVILSTCNRVEVYLARYQSEIAPDAALITEFLAEVHGIPIESLLPCVYSHAGIAAVQHLFRVVSSLDSLVLGEGQIAGQVKRAYEQAKQLGTVGPVLHGLFQHARQVAKRVRSETGVSQGKVSVSRLAVDYLTEVFDHFHDKTVLVIGAGKMGSLTLRQLKALKPGRILVTNRSPQKAEQVAVGCGGLAVVWSDLDRAMAKADIILSTTGAAQPIVTLESFRQILPQRHGRPVAIIDIAVPRDFDPRIAELDLVNLLVNIDDLHAIRDKILKTRSKHLPAAEAIVSAEQARFFKEWNRRQSGPAIARISQDWDAIRHQVQMHCFNKLNGKLSEEDKAIIEGAFKLLQNKLLHGPISVLREEAHKESNRGLLDAIYKLFRLDS
jgi:glutamyl-tRNA reductase